jgi:hypothetical protein
MFSGVAFAVGFEARNRPIRHDAASPLVAVDRSMMSARIGRPPISSLHFRTRARNTAVADHLVGKLGRDVGKEGITVGNGKRSSGVQNLQKLRISNSEGLHWRGLRR